MSPRNSDDPRGGRFGRAGHQSFQRAKTDAPAAEGFDPPTYYRPRDPSVGPTEHLPRVENGPRHDTARQDTTRQDTTRQDTTRQDVPPAPTAPLTPPPKITVTRAVASRSQQAAQTVARKVVAASRADGASESGLTQLIWNQVLSFGSDAMITVALAGTVFFSAAQSDQKGNVLGYLLITMAPFAIVAPVIGPALDRLQHGRRWAMAGSAFGRAALAVLMAQNFTNLFVLFPLALGSLVLSKAYSVVRAAAAPRLVPANMTLVSANARLSIFGLGAALVGGGLIGVVVKVSGSYPLGLWLTAAAFAVTGYYALRLPKQVDSAAPARRHPEEPPRPPALKKVPSTGRIQEWVSRGFEPQVIIAMQGASLMRWTAGFLTMFVAFYIEKTSHGFDAALGLGMFAFAVGLGNFLGTAAGARLKLSRPERIITACAGVSAVAAVVTAFTFTLTTVIVCAAITSAANSLGKLSLDAVIQKDVNETLRSSAFARSETFLQLAWVIGATIALLLPADRGTLGLGIAAAVMTVTVVLILLRTRAMANTTSARRSEPGNV